MTSRLERQFDGLIYLVYVNFKKTLIISAAPIKEQYCAEYDRIRAKQRLFVS